MHIIYAFMITIKQNIKKNKIVWMYVYKCTIMYYKEWACEKGVY